MPRCSSFLKYGEGWKMKGRRRCAVLVSSFGRVAIIYSKYLVCGYCGQSGGMWSLNDNVAAVSKCSDKYALCFNLLFYIWCNIITLLYLLYKCRS